MKQPLTPKALLCPSCMAQTWVQRFLYFSKQLKNWTFIRLDQIHIFWMNLTISWKACLHSCPLSKEWGKIVDKPEAKIHNPKSSPWQIFNFKSKKSKFSYLRLIHNLQLQNTVQSWGWLPCYVVCVPLRAMFSYQSVNYRLANHCWESLKRRECTAVCVCVTPGIQLTITGVP